jgi:hypothetical protein
VATSRIEPAQPLYDFIDGVQPCGKMQGGNHRWDRQCSVLYRRCPARAVVSGHACRPSEQHRHGSKCGGESGRAANSHCALQYEADLLPPSRALIEGYGYTKKSHAFLCKKERVSSECPWTLSYRRYPCLSGLSPQPDDFRLVPMRSRSMPLRWFHHKRPEP